MREDYREANKVVLWVWIWIIAGVIILGLVGWGVWATNVATSGVKGQGDAVIQKNSAENWVKQQAKFERMHAEYESTLVRIEQFKAASEANPNDAIAQTNYQGQISHCTDVVADYNAASRSFLSEDWKSIDLPSKLDADSCVPNN